MHGDGVHAQLPCAGHHVLGAEHATVLVFDGGNGHGVGRGGGRCFGGRVSIGERLFVAHTVVTHGTWGGVQQRIEGGAERLAGTVGGSERAEIGKIEGWFGCADAR